MSDKAIDAAIRVGCFATYGEDFGTCPNQNCYDVCEGTYIFKSIIALIMVWSVNSAKADPYLQFAPAYRSCPPIISDIVSGSGSASPHNGRGTLKYTQNCDPKSAFWRFMAASVKSGPFLSNGPTIPPSQVSSDDWHSQSDFSRISAKMVSAGREDEILQRHHRIESTGAIVTFLAVVVLIFRRICRRKD